MEDILCGLVFPKKAHSKELSHYRPVAPTSLLMKTMKRIDSGYLHNQLDSALDLLQFAFRPCIDMHEVIYLLHRALCHLEVPESAVSHVL